MNDQNQKRNRNRGKGKKKVDHEAQLDGLVNSKKVAEPTSVEASIQGGIIHVDRGADLLKPDELNSKDMAFKTDKDASPDLKVDSSDTQIKDAINELGASVIDKQSEQERNAAIKNQRPEFLEPLPLAPKVKIDNTPVQLGFNELIDQAGSMKLAYREAALKITVRDNTAFTRVELPPTNLKIIRNAFKNLIFVTEELKQLSFAENYPLELQLRIAALDFCSEWFPEPAVLSPPKELTLGTGYDDIVYSGNGLLVSDIINIENERRSVEMQPRLNGRTKREYFRKVEFSQRDNGNDTNRHYDGPIRAAMLRCMYETWEESIISAVDYHRIIKGRLSPEYRLDTLTFIEERRAFVYYHDGATNLPVIFELFKKYASEYFRDLYFGKLLNIPSMVTNVSVAALSAASAGGYNVNAINQSTLLVQSIKAVNVPRYVSMVLMSCMFPSFKIELIESANIGPGDFMDAMLLLLFIPGSSISDYCYSLCLRIMYCFLSEQSSLNAAYLMTNADIVRGLADMHWPVTQRVDGVPMPLRIGTPIYSNVEEPILATMPFNLTGNGDADSRLITEVTTAIARVVSRKPGIMPCLRAVVNQINTISFSVSLALDSYCKAVRSMRYCIPNVVANMLDTTSDPYVIRSGELHSYFATLGTLNITTATLEEFDVFAEEKLISFKNLDYDLTSALHLATSLHKVFRAKATNDQKRLAAISEIIYSQSNKPLSSAFSAIITLAGLEGKEGYKQLVYTLMSDQLLQRRMDPRAKMVEKVADVIRANLSAFGIIDKLVMTNRPELLEMDSRFTTLFQSHPFLAVLPSDAVEIDIFDFADTGGDLWRNGVTTFILKGLFSYSYEVVDTQGTTIHDHIFSTDDRTAIPTKIAWKLDFYSGENPSISMVDSINGLKLYCIAPTNFHLWNEIDKLIVTHEHRNRHHYHYEKATIAHALK
jgi:VP2 protein